MASSVSRYPLPPSSLVSTSSPPQIFIINPAPIRDTYGCCGPPVVFKFQIAIGIGITKLVLTFLGFCTGVTCMVFGNGGAGGMPSATIFNILAGAFVIDSGVKKGAKCQVVTSIVMCSIALLVDFAGTVVGPLGTVALKEEDLDETYSLLAVRLVGFTFSAVSLLQFFLDVAIIVLFSKYTCCHGDRTVTTVNNNTAVYPDIIAHNRTMADNPRHYNDPGIHQGPPYQQESCPPYYMDISPSLPPPYIEVDPAATNPPPPPYEKLSANSRYS